MTSQRRKDIRKDTKKGQTRENKRKNREDGIPNVNSRGRTMEM